MAEKAKDASEVWPEEKPTDAPVIESVTRYTEDGRAIEQFIDPSTGAVLDLYEVMELMAPTAEAAPLAELQAELGVPIHVSTENLVNRSLVWKAWQPQQALLPETGDVTDGFFCVVQDTRTNEILTVFIGGIALTRILRKLQSPHKGGRPFRAGIEKRGRTWTFR